MSAPSPELLAPLVTVSEGLIAPRGVSLRDQTLLVADTARNQVLVYDLDSNLEAPVLTLGNADARRQVGSDSTLHYPSGLWTDGQRLAVADSWNHRVLLWHTFPIRDFQAADVVLGQADFVSHEPNGTGLGAAPGPDRFYWPYGVWFDGQRLWVADTGNRRVLRYDGWPEANGAAADAVIGQASFTEREFDPDFPTWPYSVKVSPTGALLVADTQYYRCHYWRDHRTAVETPADVLLGQPDRQANGQNQYRLAPGANTLNWCYDATFRANEILVADTGNSRVLRYGSPPAHHAPPALGLIGQPTFETNGEGSLARQHTTDTSLHLYWPFALSADGDRLAVADTGKSRVLIYPL